MRSPFLQGVLELVDEYDRRSRYVAVRTEDGSLGFIGWTNRRLICWCGEGVQAYEDRLDGSLRWEDPACEHETLFLAVKRSREEPAVGISQASTFDAGVFVD